MWWIFNQTKMEEIKGREYEVDKAKWKSFPYRLKILRRDDLRTLGLL